MTKLTKLTPAIDLNWKCPEFFILAQPWPGEDCFDEESEIAASFDIDTVAQYLGYDQREDAQRVADELNRRKPSRSFVVVSSEAVR
jgi:hypothetical protein